VRPAVFLDRDGTLIEEKGYLSELDQVQPFPWSAEAVRLLRDAGFAVVVVTNQAGVARGFFDEAFVRATHAQLDARLEAAGAAVDGYYYCPHHPDGSVERYRLTCRCRKPAPGMIEAAARDLGLDVARSFVVGDKWLDVGLAENAGATGLLVRTGYGRDEEADPQGHRPAAIVDTLIDAAHWILNAAASRSRMR
jgi:D-glycero-D-manno-heptose 1,7-bisphosphate phosphatase